ncbi:MAG: type I pullulanase, partial [Bacteroidaceae bacterium]|nr:type I pullulanase [Bacteroidaceae bacterium]
MQLKSRLMVGLLACQALLASALPSVAADFDRYPQPQGDLTELRYSTSQSEFQVWAPTANRVELRLYATGRGGKATKTLPMRRASDGTWRTVVKGNLDGQFYTFNVRVGKKWLGENPGIFAKAVGINGERAAIIDLRTTDPDGWNNDRAPRQTDVVIYEMHHRDFSISPTSGITHKGKYLALTERGTRSPQGASTGIDHLKELGVTHVHILPSYDFGSIDETRLDEPQYNWGYDPVNYNVPEGSYATDPADPKSRIREFKQMVQSLHANGLKVVLDVVYNHTFDIAHSNFERTVPGYFYRQMPDGTPADASACGNETASEREVMRRYMIASVEHWMKEYHIDGFRFDLMGIHDIETMRQIRAAAERINPDVLIYGEGWAAKAPQLPEGHAAMKAEVHRMPGIAAFSDEMRDGLRGPFSDDHKAAFLAGEPGHKESIKMGIAGGIAHPQIDYTKVNYTNRPWAAQPQQLIAYVSCHDDMCLNDRIVNSIP